LILVDPATIAITRHGQRASPGASITEDHFESALITSS
jgi:hypothetical protein